MVAWSPRGTVAPGVTLTRISGSKGMQRRVALVARKGEKTAIVVESEPVRNWNSAMGTAGLSVTLNSTTSRAQRQVSPDFPV